MKTYITSKAGLQNQPSRGIQLIYDEVTSPQVFSWNSYQKFLELPDFIERGIEYL